MTTQSVNSVILSIKFIKDSEEDSKPPFLDYLLKRKRAHRKLTHTDRYLHFKSHHPNHVKKGVVRCLYRRARRVANMSENF